MHDARLPQEPNVLHPVARFAWVQLPPAAARIRHALCVGGHHLCIAEPMPSTLSTPALEWIADLTVTVAAPIEAGMVSGLNSRGRRRIIPITGGKVSGQLNGTVLPDGAGCCMPAPTSRSSCPIPAPTSTRAT